MERWAKFHFLEKFTTHFILLWPLYQRRFTRLSTFPPIIWNPSPVLLNLRCKKSLKLWKFFYPFNKTKLSQRTCFENIIRSGKLFAYCCVPNWRETKFNFKQNKWRSWRKTGFFIWNRELVIMNFMHQVFLAVLENTPLFTPSHSLPPHPYFSSPPFFSPTHPFVMTPLYILF